MTIQRLYSLPNCTLILEGLSDNTTWVIADERPLLSTLVSVDCYLATSVKPLSGGREFFESLVRAVSIYAQEFLSRVDTVTQNQPGLVQLQKVDDNQHRLIVQPETIQGLEVRVGSSHLPPVLIDLNTVQLFDLVEAVDQFLADSQTLPDLSLPPLLPSQRSNVPRPTLVKQAVPVTVGMYGLALSAIALFLVPIPTRQSQFQPIPNYNYSVTVPKRTLQTYTNPKPTPLDSDLEAMLAAAPEITKSSQLRSLTRQLYNQLNQAWTTRSKMAGNLVYRVGVTAKGAIIGYKFVNPAARTFIEQTPLPSVTNRTATPERIAQFRVVFTKNGVLQVSPWRGYGR